MYCEEPFPHIYEEGALPALIYRGVLASLPPLEKYEKAAYSPSRYMLDLGKHERYWRPVMRYLMPKTGQILNVFNKNQLKDYKVECHLIRDLKGFCIPPHTDVRKRVVSLLYYLPKDTKLAEYGTVLLKPKSDIPHSYLEDLSAGRWLADASHFKVGAQIPFLPNTMLAFERTDTSYHCVPEIPDIVRDMLTVQVMEKEEN